MHDLVRKYFEREITAEERKQMFSAMETDTHLRNEFISVQNTYALSALLPRDSDIPEAMAKLVEFKKRRKKQPFVFRYRHAIGYAATLCIAVYSTWIYTEFQANQVPIDNEPVTYEEFHAPAGQRAKVTLHDGTVVWLNARSTLRYPNRFGKIGRKVELNGEAFFDVTHNEELPFIVSTEMVDVEVLGTKFNVFAYKGRDEFSTSLVEGAVKIYKEKDEGNALFMEPNECVKLVENKLVKSTINNADYLLWKEGIYAFDDVPFNDIMKKLELYYDIQIAVNNKTLNTYRFSGKFRQRDGVESVLRTMRKVYPFAYHKDDDLNRITIR